MSAAISTAIQASSRLVERSNMLGDARIGADAAQEENQIIGSAGAAFATEDDEVDVGEADATGPRRLHVPAALSGERLVKALARLMPDVSRSRIQQWIEAAPCSLTARRAEPVDSGRCGSGRRGGASASAAVHGRAAGGDAAGDRP